MIISLGRDEYKKYLSCHHLQCLPPVPELRFGQFPFWGDSKPLRFAVVRDRNRKVTGIWEDTAEDPGSMEYVLRHNTTARTGGGVLPVGQ